MHEKILQAFIPLGTDPNTGLAGGYLWGRGTQFASLDWGLRGSLLYCWGVVNKHHASTPRVAWEHHRGCYILLCRIDGMGTVPQSQAPLQLA